MKFNSYFELRQIEAQRFPRITGYRNSVESSLALIRKDKKERLNLIKVEPWFDMDDNWRQDQTTGLDIKLVGVTIQGTSPE